jgi:uncharacterized protein involved in propanediol utilization
MTQFGKRVDGPSGRRAAPRDQVLLPAAVTTLRFAKTVDLTNVSTTGAKLRAIELPDEGQELLLKMGQVEAFGVVVWKSGDLCGIAFDQPLTDAEVQHVGQEGRLSRMTHLTPDERLAYESWTLGPAR